ncbi:ABC-2 type transport system permease protein [Halomicrobium zhouii]|uniref:ABC-2 type transport system permease protein n=1 Tax=Halomicrobium zhouii TaxID=767519 RepID=A0A1I6KPG2_9EURY|nr:ABC transporter permease subunit [Halomicrobium zhouii]SFR93071.1 ABC-2 type transport system permease protein [Halomicrobium zhouii]
MFEITRYETRRQVRGTLTMAVGLGAFAALIVGIFPSVEASGVDFQDYIESLPEAFQASFGVESFGTIEGFLAVEFYQFVWVLLLALYVAYAAGDAVAGDVESGKLDLLLATSVSRSRLLVERFLALMTPVVVLNLLVPLVVFGSVLAVGESLDPASLVLVHLLSVPYLFVAANVGLLFSVVFSRGGVAQRIAIAAVFMLFVLDSVTAGTNFEWLAALSPTRYYDPTEILVEETVDVGGAVVLLAAGLGLFAVTRARFLRRDV